jgi:glycine C-acetyltransferase/8-amino-7-oxononanoate synthase
VDEPAAVLEELRQSGLYRRLRTVDGFGDGRAEIDGRDVLVLCSNDYLGLREHPLVRQAAAEAALRWGAGVGSSRLVAGNLSLHEELEHELTEFKGAESCLLFGSGYLANAGVIPALAGAGDVILSDALNHASLIDGCRQSRAQTIVYDHCDMDSLADRLKQTAGRPALIVTDAVFSMDGDAAPLSELVELANSHGARVMVDEAHATGVVGPGGRGLVASLGLEDQVDVTIGTLSKALGSYGAFACCRRATAELLVNRARTLIFSTGLPPSSAGAGLCALRLLAGQPEMVDRLHANARLMRSELSGRGIEVGGGTGVPILPVIVGDAEEAVRRSEAALARGVFVQAIRPPTVPPGTSRLRVTVSAVHAEADLRQAVSVLALSA